MGMYTGLRGTIIFKDSLKQQIKGYLQNRDGYNTWSDALPSFSHPFLQDSRQTFISQCVKPCSLGQGCKH